MEAVGEYAPNQATRLGQSPDGLTPAPRPERSLRALPAAGTDGRPATAAPGPDPDTGTSTGMETEPDAGTETGTETGAFGGLSRCLALLKTVNTTAAAELALSRFEEASDFAAGLEELSRTMEYLQLHAAAAVDRTRTAATAGTAATPGWTTGWNTPADTGHGTGAGTGTGVSSPADDGFANTTEYLRALLRISAAEARRRLTLAAAVLPRTGTTGQPVAPEREELAAALAAGTIASRPATLITLALDRVRHHTDPDTAAWMEHSLTRTAAENDPDFLARTAHRWTDAIDQNGTEPGEEELRHRQGAFLRAARRGLHHVEIFATPTNTNTS